MTDFDQPIPDALLLDRPGGRCLRLRFSGTFAERNVIWQASLFALADELDWPADYQFIAIGAEGPDGIPIELGLQVACIDLPTIQKAMVLIRRYKRLRFGRHEYKINATTAPVQSLADANLFD